MLRKLIALAALAAVVLAPSALAANVKIRVEGKTTTHLALTTPAANADLVAPEWVPYAGLVFNGNPATPPKGQAKGKRGAP